MKSSLNSAKKSIKGTGKKAAVFLLVFVMLFSFLITPLKVANAQLVTTDLLLGAWNSTDNVLKKFAAVGKVLWQKAGSAAYQSTLRMALNKIAYETATWLGSGNKGQKPLWVEKGWGEYLLSVGDSAAGTFIETFASTWSTTTISPKCQKSYQLCAFACARNLETDVSEFGEGEAIIRSKDCKQNCKEAATTCGFSKTAAATSTSVSGSGGLGTTAKISGAAGMNITMTNICQPSSLEAKLKIGLGLVQYQNPSAANCTASEMIQNWGDEAQKITDFKKSDFLETMKGMFDPTSNDLGMYMSARNDMIAAQTSIKTTSANDLIANRGWLSKRNIAGETVSPPDTAASAAKTAKDVQVANLGKVTGDIVIDAANIFLNQYALTAFNKWMANLGKTVSENTPPPADYESDPSIAYGESRLKEALSSIIKPTFGYKKDYDILTNLSVCPDKNNPGPTDCVIDGNFMQAVTEKKTVIEAINAGYINGSWQLTKDTIEGTYSLRNISILRKYRILPVGWEEAINRAYNDPNNIKKVTVMDMISCFSDTDSYNQFSKNFNTKDSGWCLGLVDPNWVLKAPLNSCSKEGFGSQVISEMVTPSISVSGSYTASSYNIGRGENYCADEKTCIKEKTDGSCEAYGYCNEEKRTWNFSADSCDPVYNTCQSFTNVNSSKSVSYLKNTLSYAGCNADSAGCQKYSVFGSYATSTKNVSWDAGKTISLNNGVSDCSSKDEGCTELLRTKATWGSNLIMDADFNNEEVGKTVSENYFLNDWYNWSPSGTTRVASIVDSSQELGSASGKALKLAVTRSGLSDILYGGVYSSPQYSLLPDNFQLTSGQAYTVSVDVYIASGEKATLYMGNIADGFVSSTAASGSWQHLSVTRLASSSYTEPTFGVVAESPGNTITAYIQNFKFEVSNYEKDFKDFNIYGSTYKVYEKLIPPYLESVCYNNVSGATKDYTLKSNAPAVCSNFARRCNREEAGCEKFTGVKNGLSVSAQVTASDYCWGECVGYDTYISKEDYFNSPSAENIIPTTAKACSAKAVGCNEFTNLDEISAGGETKEYYSSLKRCIKPSQGTCGTFYSWEGTNTGYQLRSYSLEQDTGGLPKMIGSDNSAACNQEIYSKPLGDANYNADCREFYNAAGQISYRLVSKTITCSEDCHAYRMNSSLSGVASTQSCLNDGVWDAKLSACIYQAIPGEGSTCTAEENGCREYNGNNGNNVQRISSYDFENGLQGWTSNTTNGLQQTTISNNNNGHSAFYKSGAIASTSVGTLVSEGKSYVLRFIAKADNDTRPKIYFSDKATTPKISSFTTDSLVVKGGGGWNIYSVNLSNLDHAVTLNEILAMTADNDFYFDDVVLTEITDRYYLVKGSSVVPNRCYYDTIKTAQGDKVGNYQGPDYSLGCSQYTDRNNLTHNLRKFSKLCSSSAVGCEQVIATQNYSPYGSGIWNDTNSNGVCDSDETDCVKVERDKAIYAVFDSRYQCNSADLGCSRMGQAGAGNSWTDVYKNNTPNSYDRALCSQAEVGCEAWTTSQGTSYFKDPGNDTCQYRNSHDASISGKAWYMIPAKRCDLSGSGAIEAATEGKGAACSLDSDCSLGTCMVDNNDYACSTSYFKTFGLGGSGNGIQTPDKQAGLCQATASGCTEYIDPVSTFSINLVNNPNYATSSAGIADGWSSGEQTIALSPNKLYILSVKGGSAVTGLAFTSGAKELLVNNTLSTTTQNMTISAGTTTQIMFASLGNTGVEVSGGGAGKVIELKEAIINYQLQEEIDKLQADANTSCNGAVDFNNGCVLFNERSINGASGLASLANQYDAVNSPDKKAPVLCSASGGTCSANKLLRVSPNRVCSKWLDCLTYVTDPETKARTCYAVGECTRLNDNYECANFEEVAAGTTKFTDSYQNTTGYSLLDKYHLSNMKEVGLNTDAHYDFEDSAPALSCTRATGGVCAFSKDIITDLLVREPEGAPTDYPAHGASYLKVPASYIISPQSSKNTISVQVNQDYFVNFLVNTKNSGTGAKVKITSASGEPLIEKNFTSSNGWSRQILPFNTAGLKEIKIYLSAATSTGDRAVYFDDINIEPVLEVAKNANNTKQYVARECRLYPTNDSLTCVNKNNNVLKDGWEGYCLEHDADNPNVCSLWYPVDKISAEGSLQKSSGYQGIFPLNYCTEVNGNFDLVEKVVGAKIQATAKDQDLEENHCDIEDGCDGNGDPNYITMIAWGQPNAGKSYTKKICIPKESNLLLKTKQVAVNDFDMVVCKDLHSEYFDENKVLVYWEGWAKYDGKLSKVTSNCSGVTSFCANSGDAVCKDKLLAATSVCSELDEATNIDPSVRVYDYDHIPADEEGLKLISGVDADKIYRLTCNNFIQTVDSNGENMAWAARVGINSAYPTSTPLYFVDRISASTYDYFGNIGSSTHSLYAYGRNRETTPFGAATWPDSFNLSNSEPVKLKNQFSAKNSEDVLAGRPYGCSNYKPTNTGEQGTGCSHIGACSLNQNVYCLVGNNTASILAGTASSTDYVSKKTCAEGGYGTCVPLWSNYLGIQNDNNNGMFDFQMILRNLFLKSYNSYSFKDGYYTSGGFDMGVLSVPSCTGNERPTSTSITTIPSSFCSVTPSIKNISLNNQAAPIISAKGIYGLRFTTILDPEQEPLKEIYIDWGDNTRQTITGQDSHPSVDNPHLFYHYYKTIGPRTISVTVKDNWNIINAGSLILK